MWKHSGRKRKSLIAENVETPAPAAPDSQDALRRSMTGNKLITNLNDYPNLDDNLAKFYKQYVLVDLDESLSISESTSAQNSMQWSLERSKRICASKAYELYTYTRNIAPNWRRKVMGLIKPSKFQSAAMKYGKQTEPEARQWYEKQRNVKVSQHGFTIHPNASFMGCSPDGVLFEEDLLLEIKCPVIGKTQALSMSEINFFYNDEGTYKLKKKHIFYGQVMVNLMILNLKVCDFVAYSDFSKSGHIVKVPFDKLFAEDLLNKLRMVYFEQYLPVLSFQK